MFAVTLSPQGQLTIPIEVREALHLEAGATLNLQVEGDKIHLARAEAPARVRRREPGTWNITLSEDFDAPIPGME